MTPAPPTPLPRWSLERREALLVGLFWTFLAAFSGANRLLDPRRPGLQLFPPSAPILTVLFESALWALLTPILFRLAAAFTPSRSNWTRRVPLLLALGLVLAAGVNATVDFVRFDILDETPLPGTQGSVAFGFLRLWFVRDYMICLAVLAAGFAREYYRQYELRNQEAIRLQAQTAVLQSQLAEAQLAALRMQLNPHFLFNTLNAISALVEHDPPAVRRMIARLSDLLRSTLEDSVPERTVEAEVSFAARYLEIMQVRFEGKLEVAMDLDPEARRALVPTLILQPLVENAVKHGVSVLDRNGRVSVRAVRRDNATILTVQDNGAPPSVESSAAPSGLGLRNTAERLRQMYGSEARVSLHGAPGGGTIAEVELPYRLARA